ncbi:hypothetical protein Tco_0957498 [Tanacetum coccineum]
MPTTIQPSTSQPQKTQKPRRPRRKDTEVPQPSGPTTNVADEAVNEEMDDSLERVVTTATSLDAEQDSGNINKTQSKATLNELSSIGTSSGVNTPQSDEDSLKPKGIELLIWRKLRPFKLRRLQVGLSKRVESSDEEGLGEEDASKQGRKINDIDVDEGITLVDETAKNQGRFNDEEIAKPKAAKVVIQELEQGTTTPTLTTTTAATTTTAVSTRPRAKGLVIHEQEQAPTLTVSSQQPS